MKKWCKNVLVLDILENILINKKIFFNIYVKEDEIKEFKTLRILYDYLNKDDLKNSALKILSFNKNDKLNNFVLNSFINEQNIDFLLIKSKIINFYLTYFKDKNIIEESEINQALIKANKRYEHCLSTAKYAKEMTLKWNLDLNLDEVYMASLLHDVAKFRNKFDIFNVFNGEDNLLKYDEYIFNNLELAHGFVGADDVSKHFNLKKNDKVVDAIRYHTIGKKNASDLLLLVYISDLLEYGREYKNVDILRKFAYENDFKETVLTVLTNQLNYMINENIIIHQNGLIMRNDIIENLKNKM